MASYSSLSHDDVIYAILLLIGIAFGHFYREIRDTEVKKYIGTFFGLFIILFTSALHSLHIFLSFLVCITLIRKYEK
jgi:hypothetical protein